MKFKAGDMVKYINDYGVILGVRKITACIDTSYGPAYNIDPSDTGWYAVPERCLTLVDNK